MLTVADLAAMVRAECERLGTQQAFADKLGIVQPYVNQVIQGKKPAADAICKYFGLKRITNHYYVKVKA